VGGGYLGKRMGSSLAVPVPFFFRSPPLPPPPPPLFFF